MMKSLCSALVIYGLISACWAGVLMGRDGFSWFSLWTASFGGFGAAMGLMMFNYVTQAELELKLANTAVANLQARGRS